MLLVIEIPGYSLALLALVSLVYYRIKLGSFPQPSTPQARKEINRLIPSDQRGTIIELGSAWGHLTIALAQQHPSAAVIGIEASPFPYICSRIWSRFRRADNLTLRFADFLNANLAEADVLVCYLQPEAMDELANKIKTNSKKGVTIISNTFPISHARATEVISVEDKTSSKLYLYKS